MKIRYLTLRAHSAHSFLLIAPIRNLFNHSHFSVRSSCAQLDCLAIWPEPLWKAYSWVVETSCFCFFYTTYIERLATSRWPIFSISCSFDCFLYVYIGTFSGLTQFWSTFRTESVLVPCAVSWPSQLHRSLSISSRILADGALASFGDQRKIPRPRRRLLYLLCSSFGVSPSTATGGTLVRVFAHTPQSRKNLQRRVLISPHSDRPPVFSTFYLKITIMSWMIHMKFQNDRLDMYIQYRRACNTCPPVCKPGEIFSPQNQKNYRWKLDIRQVNKKAYF